MNSNFYAVIIGFNKFTDQAHLPELQFAEKDARDLYEALIDPKCGDVPKENICLITGNVSKMEVEKLLFVHAVRERGPEDTVLIYYSGHGFIAGITPESYLATPDTDVNEINENPIAGLPMEFLRTKIFLAQPSKRAKNMILLLDCCHSGAFCPDLKGGSEDTPRALVELHDFDSDGRVAFVSSPARVVSREDKKRKNGIFTSHILDGLRGKAIESNTGQVTVGSLVAYVQSMCPKAQPAFFYGKSLRIVIATPKIDVPAHSPEQNLIQDNLSLKHSVLFYKGQPIVPLRNPIESQVQYVDTLMTHLTRLKGKLGENVIEGNQILNSVRDSLNADFAFVEELDSEEDLHYKFWSDLPSTSMGVKDYTDGILSQIYPVLIQEESRLPSRFGFQFEVEGTKDASTRSIAIPLQLEYPREFMIISGMRENILEYGEILGHILLSLYKATSNFSFLDITKVEDFLLDEIKRSFETVPVPIYEKRFKRFKEHLHQIGFCYEPVVGLGKNKKAIEIDSWEALARDPQTNKVPQDLFDAAELWGSEFITELDIFCLRTAIMDFNEKWDADRGNTKMDTLAVNVYPETLVQPRFLKELSRIVKEEELIKGKRLVLEISEKHPLPEIKSLDSKRISDPIEAFANHIQELSKSLGIGFAIDDFGVGHSGTERLAKLELDHVKIDRDILYHPHPRYTIQYVLDLVQSSHNHSIKVVIEGFDGDGLLTLAELFNDLNIIYIQGYFVRKASPTVADLSDQDKNRIMEKINCRN
ncbi:MAG TPA: EAL domain-containing protein [Anaerolineales bacterium]|nr:EAL domain-containing protein [Anaerolineales bacterium]